MCCILVSQSYLDEERECRGDCVYQYPSMYYLSVNKSVSQFVYLAIYISVYVCLVTGRIYRVDSIMCSLPPLESHDISQLLLLKSNGFCFMFMYPYRILDVIIIIIVIDVKAGFVG